MTTDQRIRLARTSLQGLAIGDAFGDSFFGELEFIQDKINRRLLPETTKWEFTDNTVMAIAILENLEKYGAIRQDALAALFADNYNKDINRGYGGSAHRLLREIGAGKDWRAVSAELFDGQGSMGNGAAMRAAPIGAYFYDQPDRLREQVQFSAEITHAHHEAQVGATAVALAAGLAVHIREGNQRLTAESFIKTLYDQLEDSDTKSKIGKAALVPPTYGLETVTYILGNGTRLLAQDTVPFALWCVAHHLTDYEEALWTAVSGLGDRDTICAIVGSIVILAAAEETVPLVWRHSVEDYDKSIFRNP